MAVLTQFFCKMYFLYVSRSQKKNLGNFFLVLPPEKTVFFGGGQISREAVPVQAEPSPRKSRPSPKKQLFQGGKTKKKLPKFFLRLRDTYKKYILQKN